MYACITSNYNNKLLCMKIQPHRLGADRASSVSILNVCEKKPQGDNSSNEHACTALKWLGREEGERDRGREGKQIYLIILMQMLSFSIRLSLK